MTDFINPPKTLPLGSIVWAYLRDSGGPSQENSVSQQEDVIRTYCKRHGFVLVQIFKDIARSGGSVIERDEFNRMMDLSEDKNICPNGLLIWNMARFARDAIDSNLYKALLRKRGIVIHSLTDHIPDDDFAGRVVETIIDLANEEKRRQTSRDVKRGLRSLVSKGFAPGVPPRGYKRVQVTVSTKRDGEERTVSKWEPDPDLWESVCLAWRMRASGKTYGEIQAATGDKLYKSVSCWNSFFRNKAYLGYGKSGDLEVPDHHEPATTWEIFQAVQKLRDDHPLHKNHPRHPRRVGSPSLLTGFTYCLECGAMMTHSTGHKLRPWSYYICGKKDRQGAKFCPSRRVAGKHAEETILNAVLNQVLSPEYLQKVIEHARAQFGDTADLERQIALEKHKLEDLGLAIQRTLNAIESTGSPSALERLKQREAERGQILAKISSLESQLAAAKVEITAEAMDLVLDVWKDQIIKARETNDIKFIRAWLSRFVSKVELGYNRARIHYTYPMMDISPDFSYSRKAYPLCGGTNFSETAHGGFCLC